MTHVRFIVCALELELASVLAEPEVHVYLAAVSVWILVDVSGVVPGVRHKTVLGKGEKGY